jgi:hypothetical protein
VAAPNEVHRHGGFRHDVADNVERARAAGDLVVASRRFDAGVLRFAADWVFVEQARPGRVAEGQVAEEEVVPTQAVELVRRAAADEEVGVGVA